MVSWLSLNMARSLLGRVYRVRLARWDGSQTRGSRTPARAEAFVVRPAVGKRCRAVCETRTLALREGRERRAAARPAHKAQPGSPASPPDCPEAGGPLRSLTPSPA